MTAAVITATVVQKMNIPSTVISGSTERRISCLYIEGPKAAQNDWFLLSSYLDATEVTQICGWHVIREATGNAYAIDVCTYDSDDAKLVLTEATAGTAHAWVYYYN